MNFSVVYSEKQVAQPNQVPVHGIVSPSAGKPKIVAAALSAKYPGISFEEPDPLPISDFYRAHTPNYIDGIFAKTIDNGFGTREDSVNQSLPYTSGAMYKACKIATPAKPAAALVAGFHHAGFNGPSHNTYFCTFNGLMIAALKLIEREDAHKVAIIDCDMHYGDGTASIIKALNCKDKVYHFTFGEYFHTFTEKQVPRFSAEYLKWLDPSTGQIQGKLQEFKPDIIIYQSGADPHINDPLGGLLTEEQMLERDVRMFMIAKRLNVPLAWCLAGGYQVDPDGSIGTVIKLHMNTFDACDNVYG